MLNAEIVLLEGLRRINTTPAGDGTYKGEIVNEEFLILGITHIAYVPVVDGSLPSGTDKVLLQENLGEGPADLLFDLPDAKTADSYLTLGIKDKNIVTPFETQNQDVHTRDNAGSTQETTAEQKQPEMITLVADWIGTHFQRFNPDDYEKSLFEL